MSVAIRDAFELIRTIKATHTADTVSGTTYLVNSRVMHAMNTVLANNANIYLIAGLIEYATSDTSATWTAGDKVYWDDSAKKFTKTSTSNTLAGIAAEDKASTATTGMVLLIPTP